MVKNGSETTVAFLQVTFLILVDNLNDGLWMSKKEFYKITSDGDITLSEVNNKVRNASKDKVGLYSSDDAM